MMARFRRAPSLLEVEHAMRESGWIASSEPVNVVPLPRNHARLDWLERHAFRVARADGTDAHVTLGSGLDHTWAWLTRFHRECPAITCRPLHFGFASGWQVLAVAWFHGDSLETRKRQSPLPEAECHRVLAAVEAALAASEHVSTAAAAAEELTAFETAVLALPIFTAADRTVLTESVFPQIRGGALAGPWVTRLSNGDFVPRNVLVDDRDDARLIDHEFASRTHFHRADAWRWRAFGADAIPLRSTADSIPIWLEAYAVLQQLLLACRIHGPLAVMYEASLRLKQLAPVVRVLPAAGLPSTIRRALTGELQPSRREAPPQMVVAQLFWSGNPHFQEEHSTRLAYPSYSDCTVRFTIPAAEGTLYLRLDPAEAMGTATLLRIALGRVDATAVDARECITELQPDATRPVALHGAAIDAHDGCFAVRCLDSDPAVVFPPLSLGGYVGALIVEIQLRFRPAPATSTPEHDTREGEQRR